MLDGFCFLFTCPLLFTWTLSIALYVVVVCWLMFACCRVMSVATTLVKKTTMTVFVLSCCSCTVGLRFLFVCCLFVVLYFLFCVCMLACVLCSLFYAFR